jgi:hypothetical protein
MYTVRRPVLALEAAAFVLPRHRLREQADSRRRLSLLIKLERPRLSHRDGRIHAGRGSRVCADSTPSLRRSSESPMDLRETAAAARTPGGRAYEVIVAVVASGLGADMSRRRDIVRSVIRAPGRGPRARGQVEIGDSRLLAELAGRVQDGLRVVAWGTGRHPISNAHRSRNAQR